MICVLSLTKRCSDLEALRREFREELDVDVISVAYQARSCWRLFSSLSVVLPMSQAVLAAGRAALVVKRDCLA